MVKNRIKLSKFYQNLIRTERISFKKSLSLFEAMHREAVLLGIINSKNILEGLEVDIRIAKIINSVRNIKF